MLIELNGRSSSPALLRSTEVLEFTGSGASSAVAMGTRKLDDCARLWESPAVNDMLAGVRRRRPFSSPRTTSLLRRKRGSPARKRRRNPGTYGVDTSRG